MVSAAPIVEKTSPPGSTGFDRMPIGESWRSGRSNQRTRDVDPHTGDTLLDLASANGQDLIEAYAAAATAQPKWAADRRRGVRLSKRASDTI